MKESRYGGTPMNGWEWRTSYGVAPWEKGDEVETFARNNPLSAWLKDKRKMIRLNSV